MNIPRKLKIGPSKYRVIVHPEGWTAHTDKHGLADRTRLEIHVANDARAYDTLWHEIEHCIYWEAGCQQIVTNDEETLVTLASAVRFRFMCDHKKDLARLLP